MVNRGFTVTFVQAKLIRLLKEIIIAFQAYGRAHQFIKTHKLWKWILVPGLLYAILFLGSMYLFGKTSSSFIGWLSLKTGLKTWVESMQSGVLGFLFTLGGLILWLVMMLFYFSLFKFIWLIVGSPLFAWLSEKTAASIEGKEYPFNLKQLFKDVLRGIKLSLRNTLWQSVYSISLMIVAIIPVVGWPIPVICLLIECYYYGFAMLDYSCERNKMTTTQSITWIGRHKGLAIGNGIVFYTMHLLPVIGWLLAPSYAVIAATLSMIEIKKNPQSIL
jgi:CysZ protein